jgi:hypothetical protein
MSPKRERQLLLAVLKQMDAPGRRRTWRYWLVNAALWLVCAAFFFAIFRYGGPLGWPHLVLGLFGFGVGVFFSVDLYKTMLTLQWPVVGRYIDRSKIEARLHELGA